MKVRNYIWLCLLLIILPVLGCGRAQDRSGSALPAVKKNINLKTVQNISAFSLIRKALALYPDMEKALKIPKESNLPNICDTEIFVTIFNEGAPQITGVGTQGCTQERILRAVVNLTNHPNFKKFYMLKLETSALKIDFLTRSKPIDFSKPFSKIHVEPGIDGLMFQDGDRTYYQLPTDYIHFGWEPEKRGKGLRAERLKIQLKHLGKLAGKSQNIYKSYPISEFRTISFLQHRPDLLPVPLYRGNLLQRDFDAPDMARGAAKAGDYLINNIEPTGRFVYNQNPATGERSNFIEYNVVRHAGCVYSLMHLYNKSLEPRYLEKGIVTMEFLQRHLRPPLLEPELFAIRHPILGIHELGSAAMTLLALCELPDEQFAKVGLDTANKLARFLLKMQMDNGSFYRIYLQKLGGFAPPKPPRYQPGEALLALVHFYEKNPNVDWLEGAKKAAGEQIRLFDETGVPDHWTIQGLSDLYRIDPNPAYANAVFEMADALVETQYTKYHYSDYVGGFKNSRPPRTTSASARTEALAAASELCMYMGKDSKKYDDAVLLAARFLLWNQYRKENSYFIGYPEGVEGGIRGGLVDPNIRMDYNQHVIVALTGAYQIASRQLQEEAEKTE